MPISGVLRKQPLPPFTGDTSCTVSRTRLIVPKCAFESHHYNSDPYWNPNPNPMQLHAKVPAAFALLVAHSLTTSDLDNDPQRRRLTHAEEENSWRAGTGFPARFPTAEIHVPQDPRREGANVRVQ